MPSIWKLVSKSLIMEESLFLLLDNKLRINSIPIAKIDIFRLQLEFICRCCEASFLVIDYIVKQVDIHMFLQKWDHILFSF